MLVAFRGFPGPWPDSQQVPRAPGTVPARPGSHNSHITSGHKKRKRGRKKGPDPPVSSTDRVRKFRSKVTFMYHSIGFNEGVLTCHHYVFNNLILCVSLEMDRTANPFQVPADHRWVS